MHLSYRGHGDKKDLAEQTNKNTTKEGNQEIIVFCNNMRAMSIVADGLSKMRSKHWSGL